jgi:hypothetical protein
MLDQYPAYIVDSWHVDSHPQERRLEREFDCLLASTNNQIPGFLVFQVFRFFENDPGAL